MDSSSSSSKNQSSARPSYRTFNHDHGNNHDGYGAEPSCSEALIEDHESLKWRSQEERSFSKHSRFRGYDEPKEALDTMREVLDKLCAHEVQGPQLFRLESEFGLEFGEGAQFRVTGPSIKHMQALAQARKATSDPTLSTTLDYLSSIVVKRALWVPDHSLKRPKAELRVQKLSRAELTKELHGQMQSCKKEIDRLCNKSYMRHPNIVRLKGWGLCLDTFENMSPLNTRIPLLILEKATCDLGDFLASSNYSQTPFETLTKICQDIGTGLGGLHRGDVTHGDMKPENVLLFAEYFSDSSKTTWTAKLCDFGNGEAKSVPNHGQYKGVTDSNPQVGVFELFRYDGTPNWTPPEAMLDQQLNLEDLKRCDVFVYGLIVWRVFSHENSRGKFDTRTFKRQGGKGPIKEDETKINDYLRDGAYKSAAAEIKAAYNLAKLDIAEGCSNAAQIPSMQERDRLLVVLRAALQAVPRCRDQRPWKYFDRAYYRNFRSVNESPGQLEKENLAVFANFTVSNSAQWLGRLRKALEFLQNFGLDVVAHRTRLLPSLRLSSPSQEVFEALFTSTSQFVPLGQDFDNLAVVEHSGGTCYDLSLFYSEFFETMRKHLDFQASPESWYAIYSYARLRSRLKLCCWEKVYARQPTGNILSLVPYGGTRSWLSYLKPTEQPTIPWLVKGEIGYNELRRLEQSVNDSSLLFSTLSRSNIHLFIENGFFLGSDFGRPPRQFQNYSRNDTTLSWYLRPNVELIPSELIESHRDHHLLNTCAKIREASILAMNFAGDGSVEARIIQAKRRFFYTGEAPDVPVDGVSLVPEEDMRKIKSTTILHEAVFSLCYSAVEYFVACSAVPLMVRDYNNEDALTLAIRMKEVCSERWQMRAINLIIGLLSQSSRFRESKSDLPLGWDEVVLEPGLVAFQEATISPENPSFTFKRPRFSLLQETRISLGTRSSDQGRLTYDFDLVRFMHKSKTENLTPTIFHYGQKWYEEDVLKPENRPQSYFRAMSLHLRELFFNKDFHSGIDMENPWLRSAAIYWRAQKVVLFSSYLNILLVMVPLSCLAVAKEWTGSAPYATLLLAVGSSVALMNILHVSLKEIQQLRGPMELSQTLTSRLENCVVELLIGIVALTYGEVDIVRNIVIGSFLCNLLAVPGSCFFAGDQMYFSEPAIGTTSLLAMLGASISLLFYTFQATGSGPLEGLEDKVLFLSRATSLIMLLIFALWLYFRHVSHHRLFERDHLDGYYHEDYERPVVSFDQFELKFWSNIVFIILCIALLYIQAKSVVLSLQTLPLSTSNLLAIYLLPIVLPAGKHIRSWNHAANDQVDVALDLSLGFTVSVCFFLLPVFVILSWVLGDAFTLRFDGFGTAAHASSASLVAFAIADGKTDSTEGGGLLGVYFLLAMGSYFTAQ